ncbi:MAG: flagellar protein FlaG [Treponema sp.]
MQITNIARLSPIKEKKYTDVNASSKVVVQSIEDMTGDNEPAISARAFDPTLLRRVVDQIRSTFNMFDKRLHFRVNMEANTVVVEVVDSRTNTVIREIPSEEIQELKQKIKSSTGAFVDTNA